MSANNTIRANGFVELAATHDAAHNVWQGKDFGQRLTRGAPVDQWQVESGLDWTVQKSLVRFATERGQGEAQYATDADHVVLMRSDTKAPLGIASAKYKPHQPRAILDTLKNEATKRGFELETAGSLHGGAVIWAMASDGTEAEIGKGDRILSRALIKSNTNGNGATEGYETTICVVCANTMRAATQSGTQKARITHRSKYDADKMARALGLVHDGSFTGFVDMAKRLADREVNRFRAEDIVFDVLKPADISSNVVDVEKVTDSLAFKRILALFRGEGMGSAMDGRKGTAWGLLNAFTEYADHHARSTSADNRIESAWFGAGDALKSKAGAHLAALYLPATV